MNKLIRLKSYLVLLNLNQLFSHDHLNKAECFKVLCLYKQPFENADMINLERFK